MPNTTTSSSRCIDINTLQPVYDFVVLGRGPAGIAAADMLAKSSNGTMLCIEARDRDGGNTHTNEQGVDVGASWIHTTRKGLVNYSLSPQKIHLLDDIEDLFISRARELGFTLVEDNQHVVSYFNGHPVKKEDYFDYIQRVYPFLQSYLEKNGDTNVFEALKQFNKTPIDHFFMCCEFGHEMSGLDPDKATVSHALEHIPCSAGILIKEGLGNFIKALGEHTRVNTLYNAQITGIYTQTTPFTRIEFKTPDGETHTVFAKRIINTIPPTVFKQQNIQNNFPEAKRAAMDKLPRGQMNKIIIPLTEGYLAAKNIDNNSHLQIGVENRDSLFFIARPLGQDRLVALIGGELSKRLDSMPQGEREKTALAHALSYLDTVPMFHDIRENIKEEVMLTDWSSNPLSMGSYLNACPNAQDARSAWAAPIDGKIFFAGESTPSGRFDGLQTHVAGALMTGFAAAGDALQAAEHDHHFTFVGQLVHPTTFPTHSRAGSAERG